MLFQYQKFEELPTQAVDSLAPPIGTIRFAASRGPWDSRKEPPSYVHRLPSGSTVTGWRADDCHVELLLCTLRPQLPDGMEVSGCTGAMWRVRALEQLNKTSFATVITGMPDDVHIGPESGEGIEAQSWSANGVKLMVATEDGDFLSQRAKNRDWMPFRFQNVLAAMFPDYLYDGLRVRLPAMDAADLCQLQFVVAWAIEPPDSGEASWFAVDRNPADILTAAGCS